MHLSKSLRAIAAASLLTLAPGAAWAGYTTLYAFNSSCTTGCQPEAGVAERGGLLYGPTTYGDLYSLDPSNQTLTVLHQLQQTEGGKPVTAFTWHAGAFYSVAEGGGPTGNGTLFSIKPNTVFHVRWPFSGASEGGHPFGQLLYRPIGGRPAMYGTTDSGGSGSGAVFAFDLTSYTMVLSYGFLGGADGANPVTGLTYYNGLFYGTTQNGGIGCGSAGCGTLFSIDPTLGTKTTLCNFGGGTNDGINPSSRLLSHGNILYGTASSGGLYSQGTVFKFDVNTSICSTIYPFGTIAMDGAGPAGDLAFHANKLYGTTFSGGTMGNGTVFKLKLSNLTETVLHSMGTQTGDGARPESGVIYSSDLGGILYGTTSAYPGTIFSQTP